MQLVTILSHDNCPIQNLFLDWNPVYAEPFKAGPVEEENALWEPADETVVSPFACLIRDAKKL